MSQREQYAETTRQRWRDGKISWNQAYDLLFRTKMASAAIRAFLVD